MPTPITGTLVDAATNLVSAGTFVRFQLRGNNGIQPVVTGVGALVVGSGTGQGYFVDFVPNASGVISGSVYSTRDSTGLLAGEIKVNGSGTACWWEVSIWRGNKKVSSVHAHAKTGATLDIGALTPITATPVVTAPTGDSTYARLDATNTPFTGIVQFLQGILLALGKSVAWSTDLFLGRGAAGTLTVGTTAGASDGTVAAAVYQVGGVPQSGTGPLLAQTSPTIKNGVTLQTAGGTLPATIANDTAGGIVATCNAGKQVRIIDNTGAFYVGQGSGAGILLFGATFGNVTIVVPAIASGTLTLPAATDTLMGRATTDTKTNLTLTGASTGNTVSVLNAQGAIAPITGTGADAVVYTYSLPANTVETNSKGVRISCALTHSTGTANPLVKININGVNVVSGSIGTTASQSASIQATILRTAATTGGSMGIATVAGALSPFSVALAGLAWASNQTITVAFNVAASDTVAGVMFMVEQIQ